MISPNKIISSTFYNNLNLVLKSNKVKFFQLRLKKERKKRKVIIAKKILRICKKNKVKFIINDDPYLARKVKADGCHLGQNDMNITEAKKIASLATTYGVPIVPHTWGSGIGIHVALQFIANLESIPGRLVEAPFLIEYDQTENRIRDYLTTPKVEIKDGEIQIPNNPGLGVDVDERFLYDFTGSDELDIKKVVG